MKPIAFSSTVCLVLLTVCLFFASCSSAPVSEYRDFHYFAMDTVVTLRLANESLTDEELSEAAESCAAALVELEGELSSHDPDSPVSRINRGESVKLPPAAASVFETARSASAFTGGAYDFTLGALIECWNVTGGGPVPSPDAICEAMTHVGEEKFLLDPSSVRQLDPHASLDPGGVGKGYTAEQAVRILNDAGVSCGLVSLGGNIGILGARPDGKPYKIGVRDPQKAEDPSAVLGYLYLNSGFVSVSGDYERFFEENGVRYHHILDPRTGYPADSGLRSAAVWSEDGAWADALSTALFVLGEEKALALYESAQLQSPDGVPPFEAVLVSADGRIALTDGLKSVFTLSGSGYTLAE